MPSTQATLRRVAHASTRVIAMARGDSFPFYYVSEFPKSGGTWVSRMVADALQLPFPQYAVLPLGFSCVVQNHWAYSPRLNRAVYLHRDGRDVMVSYFFHYMLDARVSRSPWGREHRKTFEKLFGKEYDHNDSINLLPKFIEHIFAHPRGSRLTWPQHVESWLAAREKPLISFVSYEQLRAECAVAMRRVVNELGRDDVSDRRVQDAVDRFSMERQTGRKAGEEDRNSFIRKGAVGDWRNHFSREAAELFNDLAGDMLVALEYEQSKDWTRHSRFVGEPGFHADAAPAQPRQTVSPGWRIPEPLSHAVA